MIKLKGDKMKIYAPNYLKSFRCIADKCKHSCCIGWDIYIDDETLEKYKSMDGALGAKIKKSVCDDGEGARFLMNENGHCPFLNECGLCDIIIEKGEEYISEICTEHPRFYNFFSDRTEMGLGLCCEEASRIILSQTEDFSLFVLEDDENTEEASEADEGFFAFRKKISDILQSREIPLDSRAKNMLDVAGAEFPRKNSREWVDILRRLEIMDPAWEKALGTLCAPYNGVEVSEYDRAFENLLVYFIYRHTANAFDDTELAARVSLAYLGFRVIRALCMAKKSLTGECTFADLCEFARLYSAEIEYSEENTEALIEILE
jgi:lysine-N-methylase